MVSKLLLPELGENIEAADVSAVLVSVGQQIQRDQPVIEVETEKASLEVPAPADGRVTELFVRAGDNVKVGQVILVVETTATDEAPPQAASAVPAESVDAPAPGTDASPPGAGPPAPAARAVATARERPRIGDVVPAAPSVRALARQLGVDVRYVRGSGPEDRITREDVKAHAKQLILARAPAAGRPEVSLPDFEQWGEVARERLSKVRRVTATSMANAWSTVPHVTQFDNADITGLEADRKAFNARERPKSKLTLTAIVLDRTAAALAAFPKFNASLDLDAGEVIYKRYVHIGVAVETERGLLVPVVRDADKKSLTEISADLADLAGRARAKKIKPDELAGAGFTISNLGGLGTTYFTPIVNWPQVAILGVGRAELRAVPVEDRFEPRRIVPLSISYDHRLIDGADAARFLRWLAQALEQPLLQPVGPAGGGSSA